MIKIAPSILAADSSCFKEEVLCLEQSGADFVHFDVMDGHFVPNLTFGPQILADIKKYTSLPFDVHLMVENPLKFIPWYAKAGADILTFHLEATNHPQKVIELIKSYRIKAGISLKPDTDVDMLAPYVSLIDMILVMGVEPGFGGQSFRKDTLERIKKTREIISNNTILIEVDGGINLKNARIIANAGADILVAGTAVFKDGKCEENIKKLKGEDDELSDDN